MLERRHEREPNGLTRVGDLRRIALADDAAVGHRLDPELVGRPQVLDDRRAGGPEIHRPRPPLAAVEHVEADVRRDAVEPGAQRRAALEAVVRAPRANEGLLHGVLGVDRPEHPVAVRRQFDAVLFELLLDGERGRRHRVHASRSGRVHAPSSALPCS